MTPFGRGLSGRGWLSALAAFVPDRPRRNATPVKPRSNRFIAASRPYAPLARASSSPTPIGGTRWAMSRRSS